MSNDVSRDDSARIDGSIVVDSSTVVEISEVQVVTSTGNGAARPTMQVEIIDSSTDVESEDSSEAPAEVAVEVATVEPVAVEENEPAEVCLLYTSPSPRDRTRSRMPSSA